MGVLQDFERRLEGAVEGFFARAFRSGLQPVELAKALQRYAEDTQHVTEDGVVVPNVYRFRVNPRDHERLSTFGDSLRHELAGVVTRTANERGWTLRGPASVLIETTDEVRYGMYELTGRVEVVEGTGDARAPAVDGDGAPHTAEQPWQPVAPAAPAAPGQGLAVRVLLDEPAQTVPLTGSRCVAGRLPSCDVPVEDQTVSREHAAFVRRGDQWWVVDLDSTNGTSVAGRRVAEHPLSVGDRVQLGEVVLEIVEA